MPDNLTRTAAGEDSAEAATYKQKVADIKKRLPSATMMRKSGKKRKLKPDDFPKRPLSAYNIFFKETREKLLSTMKSSGEEGQDRQQGDEDNGNSEGKSSMVKHIASLWKTLDQEGRERVGRMAQDDLQRYKREVQSYEEDIVFRNRKQREEAQREKKRAQERDSSSVKRGSGSDGQHQPYAGFAAEARSLQREPHFEGSVTGSSDGVEDGEVVLERLLSEEIRALEKAQFLKMRQHKLARQLEAANPHSCIMASLNAERASRALGSLTPADSERYGGIDTTAVSSNRRGGREMLGGRNHHITSGSSIGPTRPPYGISSTRSSNNIVSRGTDYELPLPEASRQLNALQRQQNDVLLRLQRLREENEFLQLRMQHDAILGGRLLSAQHSSLPAAGGGSSMAEVVRRTEEAGFGIGMVDGVQESGFGRGQGPRFRYRHLLQPGLSRHLSGATGSQSSPSNRN